MAEPTPLSPLVSTQWLAERLEAADLRVFDATVHLRPSQPGPYVIESGRADYESGHIPGAAFADLGHDLSDSRSDLRFTMPPVAELEEALSRMGLGNDHTCVIYSTGSVMWATRLWWMLISLGFERVYVLDGGFAKWRLEERPIARGTERYPAARFTAAPDPRRWADQAEVRSAIGSGRVCTINALTKSLHTGTSEVNYGRKGHIAGSVNVPYPSLLNPDGTFRDVETLRAAFDAVGALRASRTICYCGGGISATMDAAALFLLGHADIAVYDGSLSEWVRDPGLPMETGD